MARHKDMEISLPEGTKLDGTTTHSWDVIHTALLMDIRDELKQLNSTLGCYRVGRMTDDVQRIDKRLAKHLPLHRKGKRL